MNAAHKRDPDVRKAGSSKQGSPRTLPILDDELRAPMRKAAKVPLVFTSERGSSPTTAGTARMIERAGEAATCLRLRNS